MSRLLTQCGLAAILVAAIVVCILYLFSTEEKNEYYTGGGVAFLQPDYGQYTYAGCRCSRVGVPMNNGVRSSPSDSGMYSATFNQAYEKQ